MRKYIFGFLAVVLVVGAFLQPSPVSAADPQPGKATPLNPEFEEFMQQRALEKSLKKAPAEPFYGLIPHPMDLRHVDQIPVQVKKGSTLALPSAFDWRTLGKVTPIKNQNPCGTCWCFGTTAALESRAWIVANTQYDFSEQNLACCTDPSWTYLIGNRCMGGGGDFIATDTFIKKGARLESCDPYNTNTIDSEACQDCPTTYKITDFRWLAQTAAGNEAAIKDAIYTYGPVEASFYYDSGDVYSGYIIHHPNCTNGANHLISIVGWDDTFSYGGVNGAWIIKNSWGTGAGQNGYYYMTYGSSSLGEVGYYKTYKASDLNEKLYYWDEAGLVYFYGWPTDDVGQMASLFTASPAGTLTHVDFWTTSNNAQYTIYVYDGSFGSLLTSQSGTCAEMGYYSIPLTNPVQLSNGQQFTVAVSMRTPGYNYPLPMEGPITGFCNPPIQTGKCFVRHYDSDSWYDASGPGSNVCLRARVDDGTQKLVGHDDASFSGYGLSNYISVTKFTASATGTVTEFRIKCSGNGHVKVAMYADSGGNPDSLLNSVGSTSVVSGWNTISLPSTPVTKDTAYWLAYISDANNICGYQNSGAEPKRWKTWAFSNAFPNPAGSDYSSGTGGDLVAGWGTVIPPTPPSAPTVTNSTGASNISSTSARLNGEVTSTGNENPSVTIYWGTTDDGTTPGSWTNNVNLGTKGLGTFYADISSLTPNTTYYYRCFAQNSAGPNWAATSAQFTTLVQTQKLVGHDDASFSGYGLSNYISVTKFTASATGTVTEFRIKCSGNGHVKVAMYADSGGNPGSLLNSTGSTSVVNGWNTISFPSPSTSVTKDTAYWLAYISDTNNICGYQNSGAEPKRWKTWAFSDAFPNPAGSGYSSGTSGDLVAGWGTVIPPTPPPPPDLLSPGTAITFKWGAADRATKYQLQVSTSSSFATTVFDADVGNNTSLEVTGLSLGTPYYWHVRAGNNAGWGDWSTTRSVTVNQVP